MSELESPSEEQARRPPRVVFLLPAVLTLGNVFLGFFSIVKALEGKFLVAAVCLVFAGLLDKFDGLVARKTGTSSDFGKELDSLADVLSFGMAPALLAFTWGLRHVPKLGWAACFLFLVCGALRLARYNVQSSSTDRRWFAGLPTPAAAAVPVTLVMFWSAAHPDRPQLGSEEPVLAWLLLILMTCCAFLMVSTFRYFAFKDVRVERRQRLAAVVGLLLLLTAIANWPTICLLVLAVAYMASGPAMKLWSFVGRRRAEEAADAVEAVGEGS